MLDRNDLERLLEDANRRLDHMEAAGTPPTGPDYQHLIARANDLSDQLEAWKRIPPPPVGPWTTPPSGR